MDAFLAGSPSASLRQVSGSPDPFHTEEVLTRPFSQFQPLGLYLCPEWFHYRKTKGFTPASCNPEPNSLNTVCVGSGGGEPTRLLCSFPPLTPLHMDPTHPGT